MIDTTGWPRFCSELDLVPSHPALLCCGRGRQGMACVMAGFAAEPGQIRAIGARLKQRDVAGPEWSRSAGPWIQCRGLGSLDHLIKIGQLCRLLRQLHPLKRM